ncbi:hypothetical protein F5X99DRAFT_401813 [Biscogniauxia marginata]|nr:hypothetical protein F5X99DRAFT_401813 [Biscogniauxia marginata]
MRKNVVCLSALSALATASPLTVRQNIDFAVVEAAPDPPTASIPIGPTADVVTYNFPAATQEAVADPLPVKAVERRYVTTEKREACSVQPAGTGPIPSPDTAESFLNFDEFTSAATRAQTPAGYYSTFTNLKASSSAYGYMGYTTLESYDTGTCAARCNDINGCLGFNIYFERDPSVEPGTGCENPESTTAIKCIFWGGYVEAANAKNEGQWRANFHVVIAGSNGYMKSAVPTVQGYTGVALGDRSINAPLDCNGKDTYMGSKIFTTSTFDPNLCAAACKSQNEYNTAHPPENGKPMICKFFTTYLMAVNGSPEGQYCVMYTEPWEKSYATNDGQWRGSDHYTIGYAFSYSNDASPGVPVCPKDIEYLKTEGSEFCTAYIGYQAPSITTTASTTTFPPRTASATTMVTTTITPFTNTITSYSTYTAWVKRSEAIEQENYRTRSDFEELASIFPNLTETASSATNTAVERRALATPVSISRWESASISAACSQVATGTNTVTATNTITSPTTVTTATNTQTQTVTATAYTTTVITIRQGTDGRCGPNHNYQSCGSACCSMFDWCGGASSWCSSGCQPLFGKCW